MANATGACLCGRVRYTVTGGPVFSGLCHCRNCQRHTGSTFEAVAGYAWLIQHLLDRSIVRRELPC